MKPISNVWCVLKGVVDVAITKEIGLTLRETEIMRYIADGNTNREIGYILGISEKTVKTHISAIFRKLNATCRANAVVLAIRDNWISAG